MLLKSFLILLIAFLSGCAAPPEVPNTPECVLISVEGLEAYLYCRNSDGSGERWKVTVPDANKYICTSPEGYASGKKYVQDVNDWIKTNCKGTK